MVFANIFLVRWAERTKPGWLKRWLVSSIGLGLTAGIIGGLLSGDLLAFVIIFSIIAPIAVAQSEFDEWQRESQRKKFERVQEQEDSTLSPFLRGRAKKK